MLRNVFWDLKEWYKEIELRSSMLNSFLNPSPFEFTNTNSKAECMSIWDSVHHIMQNTMLVWIESWLFLAKECRHILQCMSPHERKEMKFIIDNLEEYANIAERFTRENWMIDAMETKYQTMIECSWYLVNFSGTMDAVICNNEPVIIDIKTSWSKRDQYKADWQRQKYYYAYLYNAVRKQNLPIKFIYLVVTKQKKVQVQQFEYIISFEDAERITKADMRTYLTHITDKDTSLQTIDVDEKEIWYECIDTSV